MNYNIKIPEEFTLFVDHIVYDGFHLVNCNKFRLRNYILEVKLDKKKKLIM